MKTEVSAFTNSSCERTTRAGVKDIMDIYRNVISSSDKYKFSESAPELKGMQALELKGTQAVPQQRSVVPAAEVPLLTTAAAGRLASPAVLQA
eukprot:2327413-Pyramimonas_sp.AAC.1